ncbi:pre-peptidase C-terminal domain-containing protein [Luteimonas sp. R10]|uniref:pre-peptidase C-terminal domain-containing protein n=1 Tax=Luteimonas sp. R10 TaxID=3108176 RepID=UPI00308A5487|nr:pre-peptidase C-terminal domain-containing protein [Luteimonas sp. R10]
MPRDLPIRAVAMRVAAALALLLAAATALAADWQWRAPLPQGNALRAIAYGHDRYVAVGDAGTLVIADDGDTWRRLAPATRASLRAVAFGDGVFVAVGDNGAMVRSDDGEHWEAVESGVGDTLYHVAHGPAGFVAAGGLSLVVSPDGLQWTGIEHGIQPDTFPPSLQGVAYGNGRYVVPVGLGPITSELARVLVSTDAVNWTMEAFNGPPEGDWGGGPVFFRGLVFGGGYFVAAGIRAGNSLPVTFRSSDGVSWEWFRMPVHNGWRLYLKSLTYDAAHGRFVGLANPNDPPPSPDLFPTVVESADGGQWMVQQDLVGPPIQPIRFAHDRLFGFTAQGEIHGSADAGDWALATAPARAWQIRALAGNASGLVAAGNGPAADPGPLQEREGVVLHSTDGATWETAVLPAAADHVTRQTYAAAASATAFVVAAQETSGSVFAPPIVRKEVLYVRQGGGGWSRIDVAALGDVRTLISAAHGGGTLLVTGQDSASNGIVLRSIDHGQTWQHHAVEGTTATPARMAYGDAGFIAVPYGSGTNALVSTDGIHWNAVETWEGSGASLSDIAYFDGTYLIAATRWEDGARVGWLLRSPDGGASWQAERFASHAIAELGATPSGFVLSATGGEVLMSVDGMEWSASWSGAHSPGPVAESANGHLLLGTANGGLLEYMAASGAADLVVGAEALADSVAVGTTLAFAATVANRGPDAAELPGMGFALDAALDDLAVSGPGGWRCDAPSLDGGTTTVTCSADALAADADAVFGISATAPPSALGGTVTLVAAAAAQTGDPNESDNAADASIAVTGGAVPELQNGVAVTGIEGAAGDTHLYRIEVPAGARNLRILSYGGSGDVTLTARLGELPTDSDYDAISSRPGNNETIHVAAPAAGTWYIRLLGVRAHARVSLRASFTP